FLYAGCGYGGSCFPKDVKALIQTADQKGYELRVLKAVEEVNASQKQVLYHKLEKHFNGSIGDKTICIWGLSFKPNTDDMREAPSLVLIEKLLKAGCKVRVFDPVAMHEAKVIINSKMASLIDSDSNNLYFAHDIYDAVLDADALLLVTEWKEFRMPSWGVVKKSMKGSLILDGRNIYDKNEMKEVGFEYDAIGY
ncbi:MAG TPA: UDP binding domain-containing protein, partial [Paludibacter sp.]